VSLTYARACKDAHLFGPWFAGETWSTWRVIDKAIFGEALNATELTTFKQLAGGREPPTAPVAEAWIIAGRRSAKSAKAASIACYLATVGVEVYGWRKSLVAGERGVIQVLAVDRDQAQICFNYVLGYLTQPTLAEMVRRQTADTVELDNNFTIEITTADRRSVRGRTVAAVIFDEVAHWAGEDAAHSDEGIYQAVKPSMATIKNSLLIAISSPHMRRGLLWQKFSECYGKSDAKTLVLQAPTWTLNPTLSVDADPIKQAFIDDPQWASAEYGAEFRRDLEAYVSLEALNRCTDAVSERLPEWDKTYACFVDPSGGSSDSMTMAITHCEGKTIVLDAIREVVPPFSPNAVVEQFCEVLRKYQIATVYGDRYGGEWCREPFLHRGVNYEISERSKSDIYRDFLPLLNSRSVALLDHRRMRQQFMGLERRSTRGGRDSIDHAHGGKDDICNAVAGACLCTVEHGVVLPSHRLPTHAIGGDFDPLASADERAAAAHREEARAGYFTGPGWAPTWHDDGESQQTLGGN
jgi:pimeloyl-ACP methyl ester carboxylesterase